MRGGRPDLVTLSAAHCALAGLGLSRNAKLTTLTLKTKLLKSSTVGKQAFKGTSKKLVVKVPKSAKKPYAKFMKKGNKKLRLK